MLRSTRHTAATPFILVTGRCSTCHPSTLVQLSLCVRDQSPCDRWPADRAPAAEQRFTPHHHRHARPLLCSTCRSCAASCTCTPPLSDTLGLEPHRSDPSRVARTPPIISPSASPQHPTPVLHPRPSTPSVRPVRAVRALDLTPPASSLAVMSWLPSCFEPDRSAHKPASPWIR